MQTDPFFRCFLILLTHILGHMNTAYPICMPSYGPYKRQMRAIVQHPKPMLATSWAIWSHHKPYGCHHTASKADVSSHLEPYEAIISHIDAIIQHPKPMLNPSWTHLEAIKSNIKSIPFFAMYFAPVDKTWQEQCAIQYIFTMYFWCHGKVPCHLLLKSLRFTK